MNIRVHLASLALLIISAALFAASCGGISPQGTSGLQGPADIDSFELTGLPQLPDGRSASQLVEQAVSGSSYIAASDNILEMPPALWLNALGQQAGLQWSQYGFDLQGHAPLSVSVDMSNGAGSNAYIALADYDSGRWEIHGPYADDCELANADARYISASDTVFVAVLAPAGNDVTVNGLLFSTDDEPGNGGDGGNGGNGGDGGDGGDGGGGGGGNQSPTASLSAALHDGVVHYFDFDATASSDPDGSIMNYEYDFDGDGTWDTVLLDDDDDPSTVSWIYTEPGYYSPVLRVTDDDGAMDTDTIDILVRGYGDAQHIDTEGLVGSDCSLLWVDGAPAISYYDEDNGDLCYVRASDAEGQGWGQRTVVDSTGNVGRSTCLAIVDGFPAISYYDVANGDLKYVRANDAAGLSWGNPVSVATEGDVGIFNSLIVVDGNPAIAYKDSTGNDLGYVRANDAQGSAWGQPGVIVDQDSSGHYCRMIVAAGRPAICYYGGDGTHLMYVRAQDSAGNSWQQPAEVDGRDYTGKYASMQLVDGRPAIACVSSGGVSFIRAADDAGDNWEEPLAISTLGSAEWTSLAIVDGRPQIAYYRSDKGALYAAKAQDNAGGSWDAPLKVKGSGNFNASFLSLAAGDGVAGLACYDISLWDPDVPCLGYFRIY